MKLFHAQCECNQTSLLYTQWHRVNLCVVHLWDTKADVSTTEYFALYYSYWEGGTWTSVEVKQHWAWLPWLKTEVSSSMTYLLQPLWKCFTHRQTQPSMELIHSLPNQNIKQSKNSHVCVNRYPLRWEGLLAGGQAFLWIFSARKGAKSSGVTVILFSWWKSIVWGSFILGVLIQHKNITISQTKLWKKPSSCYFEA